ncbi:autotransporter outer membrane beta-barrel domain-containing protein [uncultured Phascolarctobacterium sp.]|uniref:autotransporter outer membrane beta-barrel domain-containing protein n=1 Tax=uncultured Phascolarctobacterium sp. TaxID=512296 RepID=UPI00265D3140|nr:autotransporter outer membrane beta-barrel domain-containing protein [uncultured Phascolarctobacterium sp.]
MKRSSKHNRRLAKTVGLTLLLSAAVASQGMAAEVITDGITLNGGTRTLTEDTEVSNSAAGTVISLSGGAELTAEKDLTVTAANGTGKSEGMNINGSTLTVAGKTVIGVTCTSSNTSHYAYGISMSSLSGASSASFQDLEINSSSAAGAAFGISGSDACTNTVNGTAKLNVTAGGSSGAIGIQTIGTNNFGNLEITAVSAAGSATGINYQSKAGKTASVTVTGTALLTVKGQSAWGIKSQQGSKSNFNELMIIAEATQSDAYGIHSLSDAENTAAGTAAITANAIGTAASSTARGIYAQNTSKNTFEKDLTLTSISEAGAATGISNYNDASTAVGGNTMITVRGNSETSGIYLGNNATGTFGKDLTITAESSVYHSRGIRINSTAANALTVGGNTNIMVTAGAQAQNAEVCGISLESTATNKFQGNTVISVIDHSLAATGTTYGIAYGVKESYGSNTFEKDLTITVVSDNNKAYGMNLVGSGSAPTQVTGGDNIITAIGKTGAYGINISNGAGKTFAGGTATYINLGNTDAGVSGRAPVENYGIQTSRESAAFANKVIINNAGCLQDSVTYGVYGENKWNYIPVVIDFQKGLVFANQTDGYALYATGEDNSSLTKILANSSGGSQVYLTGAIKACQNGEIHLKLDTQDSYYKGTATIEQATSGNNAGVIDLELANGAKWDVTGDSHITNLVLGAGGGIDLQQQAGHQELQADNLSGSGGTIVIGSDLRSDQADKLIIGSGSNAGSQNIIAKDANGTASGKALIASDASNTLDLEGGSGYFGGLHTYTADVAAESNGSGTDWYLRSVTEELTETAATLLQSSDAVYSGWVHNNDSLNERLGEVHADVSKQGVWARVSGGRLKGSGLKNNYQTYQLGYDALLEAGKDNAAKYKTSKWLGGAAIEYTAGSTGYTAGSGENNMTSLALYGTKYNEKSGDKLDIVLKHGQIKGELTAYGIGSDRADYKTRASSLSLEYGKRLQQQSGCFLEPQLQMTLGHINGNSYTTAGGTRVDYDSINSAVGRLGIAVGKQFRQGNVYLQASALHEFGGSGGISLTAANGETAQEKKDYSGSWYELKVGGNVSLNPNNDLYFDVARSFGGDFQKQWQINAGLRFSF